MTETDAAEGARSVIAGPDPAAGRAGPPAARVPWRRWAALAVLLTGSFNYTLDFFVVNVAIPSLQRDLHANAAAVQFVVAGYGVATAAGLITGGRLGDLFGRRRMFFAGLVLFCLASAACGLAPHGRDPGPGAGAAGPGRGAVRAAGARHPRRRLPGPGPGHRVHGLRAVARPGRGVRAADRRAADPGGRGRFRLACRLPG